MGFDLFCTDPPVATPVRIGPLADVRLCEAPDREDLSSVARLCEAPDREDLSCVARLCEERLAFELPVRFVADADFLVGVVLLFLGVTTLVFLVAPRFA